MRNLAIVATVILGVGGLAMFAIDITAAIVIYGLMAFDVIPYSPEVPKPVWFFLALSVWLMVVSLLTNIWTKPE